MARKIKINRKGDVEIQHFDAGGVMQPAISGTSTLAPGANGTGTNLNAANPQSGLLGEANSLVGLNDTFGASAANTQAGTSVGQLNDAYKNAQSGLSQQQNLVNALQPGGTQAATSQQALLQALQAQSQGQGPNPAQAMLNQNTGNNIASQAALMAGQRGSAANPGASAAAIANQGAATQQQAVGQGATLQAQQQLAAQQNLAAQQQAMVAESGQNTNALNQGVQNEQNILQNANTSYNNANVGMQENINNVNAGTAAANQNMNANTLGSFEKGVSTMGGLTSMLAKGGMVKKSMSPHMAHMAAIFHPKKFADGGEADSQDDFAGSGNYTSSSSSNGPGSGGSVNLPADQTNLANDVGSSGGGSGGGSSGAGGIMSLAALMAKGGKVKKFAAGGMEFNTGGGYTASSASAGPGGGGAVSLPANKTNLADSISSKKKAAPASTPQTVAGTPGANPSDQSQIGVDGTDPNATELAAKGGWMGMTSGGGVPGKPKVDKDSYSNDTVKAMLSPGEVVIPLHVMHSDDPAGNAAKFVAALVAKHGKTPGKEADDFKSALKNAINSRKKKA